MKLSKIFEIISNTVYSDNDVYANKKICTLKDYSKVISTEPVLIKGNYSIYKEDIVDFKDKILSLSHDSIFVYDETGHTGEWTIREYSSLLEVEKFVLSGAGYFNMFCTNIVVFTYDAVLDFSIYYINMDDGVRVFLDKDNEPSKDYDLKIEWKSRPI